jgi:hypothetical protein
LVVCGIRFDATTWPEVAQGEAGLEPAESLLDSEFGAAGGTFAFAAEGSIMSVMGTCCSGGTDVEGTFASVAAIGAKSGGIFASVLRSGANIMMFRGTFALF